MTENPFDPSQQPPVPPPGSGQQPGYPQPYGQPPGYPQPYGQLPGSPPAGYDPQAPHGRDMYGRPLSSKSKIIAGILQLLVGWTGAGRWYTGHYGMAVAMLLTCGGAGIWALVDGILLLVKNDWADSEGRILRASA